MKSSTEEYIRSELTGFVASGTHNALPAHGGMKIYDAPLVGFAAADDALFEEFRKEGVVGPAFLPPAVWLPGARAVVSYFLPFTKEVRDTNRLPGLPSQEWASARIDGEAFNNEARTFFLGLLHTLGAQAVAPVLDVRFCVTNRIANWSERHVAYAAGLGTFGLHRALITKKGSAGRLGSVVTTLALKSTAREYDRFDAYCPYLTRGACGACMLRCPPHAISEKGKDHAICSDYIDREVLPLFAPRYGCAKCNIAVPCEAGIPKL